MTSPLILAPTLTRPDFRILRAQLNAARLQPMPDVAETWEEVCASGSEYVLSVGKDALDLWHEWGLIQVGAHRGNTFRPIHTPDVVCMVIQHPGVLLQTSLVGHHARDDMARDIRAFRMMLEGRVDWRTHEQTACGGCVKSRKVTQVRDAQWWVDELDHAGLCEDHYRRRAVYTKKARGKKAKPGTREAQIEGQLEWTTGDGMETRAMVPK